MTTTAPTVTVFAEGHFWSPAQIRAAFIQGVCDNGFSKGAVKTLPKYRITDYVTARMWLRDAAVWVYNLRAADRERLRRQELIFGGVR